MTLLLLLGCAAGRHGCCSRLSLDEFRAHTASALLPGGAFAFETLVPGGVAVADRAPTLAVRASCQPRDARVRASIDALAASGFERQDLPDPSDCLWVRRCDGGSVRCAEAEADPGRHQVDAALLCTHVAPELDGCRVTLDRWVTSWVVEGGTYRRGEAAEREAAIRASDTAITGPDGARGGGPP